MSSKTNKSTKPAKPTAAQVEAAIRVAAQRAAVQHKRGFGPRAQRDGNRAVRIAPALEYLASIGIEVLKRQHADIDAQIQASRVWVTKRYPEAQPGPSLAERHAKLVRSAVSYVARMSLDLSVSGSLRLKVSLTRDPARVGASSSTSRGEQYSRRCTYSKTDLDATFVVPHAWLSRVKRRNLDEVDGLLTLDAQALDSREPGIEVFQATWVRQGRGKSLVVEHGVIARGHGEAFHGKTYASALQGLRRKLSFSGLSAEERTERAVASFVNRWGKDQREATIGDAQEIGACDYGIQSWCFSVGLETQLAEGRAKIADLAAAYAKRPLPEVRRTILFAVRRAEGRETAVA